MIPQKEELLETNTIFVIKSNGSIRTRGLFLSYPYIFFKQTPLFDRLVDKYSRWFAEMLILILATCPTRSGLMGLTFS